MRFFTSDTLYRFFLEKEIRNEQQQDVFDVIAGKSTLNEEETALVKRYLGSSSRAIREQITEFVRIHIFLTTRHAYLVSTQRKRWSKQCNGRHYLNHIIAKYCNL